MSAAAADVVVVVATVGCRCVFVFVGLLLSLVVGGVLSIVGVPVVLAVPVGVSACCCCCRWCCCCCCYCSRSLLL